MSLADLVRSRREELSLSYREAATRSGGLISHGRLAAIESGDDHHVSDRLLQGISVGLDIPITKVRKAAGAPPMQRPFKLPDRASRLSSRERKLVLELVEVLLAKGGDSR